MACKGQAKGLKEEKRKRAEKVAKGVLEANVQGATTRGHYCQNKERHHGLHEVAFGLEEGTQEGLMQARKVCLDSGIVRRGVAIVKKRQLQEEGTQEGLMQARRRGCLGSDKSELAAKIIENLEKKKPKLPGCSEARSIQRTSVAVAKALLMETQNVGTDSVLVDSSEDNSNFENEQDGIEIQMCQRLQQRTVKLEDIKKSIPAMAKFIKEKKKQAKAMTLEVPQIKDDEVPLIQLDYKNRKQCTEKGVKPDDMNADDWIELDELARSTIMLTLHKSVYFNVKDTNGAYGVWSALSNLYEKKSAASQVYWLKKMIDLHMKESTPMSNHLNEFHTIVSQLQSQGVEFDDFVRAMFLLVTLPNSWNTFRTAVSNSAAPDGLKCVDVESSLLMEEVNRKNVEDTKSSSPMHVRGRSRSRGNFERHDKSKSRSHSKSRPGKGVECYYCHTKDDDEEEEDEDKEDPTGTSSHPGPDDDDDDDDPSLVLHYEKLLLNHLLHLLLLNRNLNCPKVLYQNRHMLLGQLEKEFKKAKEIQLKDFLKAEDMYSDMERISMLFTRVKQLAQRWKMVQYHDWTRLKDVNPWARQLTTNKISSVGLQVEMLLGHKPKYQCVQDVRNNLKEGLSRIKAAKEV
ncbi:hypothetical protein L7F22_012863 [Adiantum nelumboides]|nr:hypothetical protein [Adiantum nelumboides]